MMVRGAHKRVGGPQAKLVELTFHVPELRQRPLIGGGCCALPVEFLIQDLLNDLEQVRRVVVSDEEGLVRVWVTEADQGLIEELKDRIEGLGLLAPDLVTAPP